MYGNLSFFFNHWWMVSFDLISPLLIQAYPTSDLLSKSAEEVSEIRKSQLSSSGEVTRILKLVENIDIASRKLEGKTLRHLHILHYDQN